MIFRNPDGMWRLLSAIPRVLRQHVTGARASASVCVDDDVECSDPSEVYLLNDLIRQRIEPCFVSTCDGERLRRTKVFTNDAVDDGKKRQRTTHCHFWSSISSHHGSIEFIGLGAAVAFGIEYSKQKWREHYGDSNSRRCPCPYLLYQVVFALPGVRGKKSVLDTDKKCHIDTGQGEPQNALCKVMSEFKTVCDKYTAVAKTLLGLQKFETRGVSEALPEWQNASDLGYAKAQFNLGLCYETGHGVKQDLKEAFQYYSLAAAGGHPQATYNLALLYLNGQEVKKDTKFGFELLEKAAELGVAQAQTYLGVHYSEAETHDMGKAVSFLTAAADQNDTEAQYFLGICHEQGWGVEVDECKAASLYTQSAQSGHDGALYNLAVFHEYGLGGISVDRVSAEELYLKAAKAGNENATLKLQGVRAREALVEWKDKYETIDYQPVSSEPVKIKRTDTIKLRSSASSPTLTDYVKDQLSQITLGKEIWNATKSIVYSDISEDTRNSQMSIVNSDVIFTLGVDNNDMESLDGFDDRDNSSVGVFPGIQSCSAMHRNSTMPNLSCLPCL